MPEVLSQGSAALPPWISPNWGRLAQARAAGRLPHALMVAGPRGVGKRLLVERLVRSLLCPSNLPDGSACGRCPDCLLLAAGTHPDLLRVGPDPESKSGEIPIDGIRDLRERAILTGVRGGRVLVVIDPADRMSVAAANALLKTLEEPPGSVLLCLIAEQPGRLPATVRSRCLLLRQPLPPRDQALRWLSGQAAGPAADSTAEERLGLARGAPLSALEGADGLVLADHGRLRASLIGIARGDLDPVAEAVAWSEVGAKRSLDWLAGWLCDLLRLAAAGADARLDDVAAGPVLAELASGLDQIAAHRLLRQVFQAVGLTESTANPQLLLETRLVEWSRLFVDRGRGRAPGKAPARIL